MTSIISMLIGGSGYKYILIRGVILTLIYVFLMWFMGMNAYEKELFFYPIEKLKRKINGEVI